MDFDDIIYLSSLFFSIGFGNIFRKIQNNKNKIWFSTIVGFIIVFIVCGKHILHPVLCTLINSLIISKCNARFCHILSFVFTFTYLLFVRCTVYFGFSEVTGHANLVQMMLTLKLDLVIMLMSFMVLQDFCKLFAQRALNTSPVK